MVINTTIDEGSAFIVKFSKVKIKACYINEKNLFLKNILNVNLLKPKLIKNNLYILRVLSKKVDFFGAKQIKKL